MAAEAPTFLPFFYPALAAVAQRQPAIFEKIVNSALATVSHATVTQDGYCSSITATKSNSYKARKETNATNKRSKQIHE